MNRIRGGATALGFALFVVLLAAGQSARAQETTGRVVGRVVDKDSGAALGGVTVIAQGPQGEDATITDDKGDYLLTALPVGTYTLRFYVANASSQVEQPGVVISAEKTVRVNQKIGGAAQAAAQQTYVVTGRVPMIDVGSARVGTTFHEDFMLKVPNGLTYGDVILKAPGVFLDGTGNISINGATGLENIYMVNGLNVTGMEMGNLESGASSLGGGSNLPIQFLTQIDVNGGGYQAEYGGAMGGVINTVLKSGSNEFHGSVFGYWSPYWLSSNPNAVALVGSSLGSVRKPDFDTTIGFEVGGPIVKDKLFFWAGFAPRLQDTHVFRLTYAQTEDPLNPGQALLDANGNPRLHELTNWRARNDESRRTYSYAATLDWTPLPDSRLTVSAFGTPSTNNQIRNVFGAGLDSISTPAWAQENLTKTNSDFTARWVSKLFDRHWIIEANTGVHREDFNDRSPNAALNGLNQLEYWGTNLWDLEHAPGCEPTTTTDAMGVPHTFQPCPVGDGAGHYHAGGFGLVKQFTGHRWMGELKSTNLFQAGGHHELKYGWRLEYSTFDQDRYYSGPLGGRALETLAPNGGGPAGISDPNFSTFSFFSLQPGQYPSDFGGARPYSDLLTTPNYQDHLKANVSSLSNAFFLQDSYSPAHLRNLTINLGARLELQKMTDLYGKSFLDTSNLGPRIGVIYDPWGDGLSKISASYGRYYEAIPMNLAARYFGGEGILVRNGVPLSNCPAGLQNPTPFVNGQPNPNAWTGNGEWAQCSKPPLGGPDPAASTSPFNNGTDYPVQANLKGQYNNEIVATIERELMEDLVLRLDYVHRWIGTIIEDGTADPNGSFAFVLANPGDVPKSALDEASNEVKAAQKAVDAFDPNNPAMAAGLANANSQLANAQSKLANLQGIAAAPKPERTYDGITLSLAKRFSKNWYTRASYTYSRLVGNYEGLFQNESSYFAPNGSNQYDTPDLYLNQRGYLPNDRPHQGRVDGYYAHPIGKGTFTFGLSFSAQSGIPRNYLSAWYFNSPQNQLLPRGSGGRTPPVSQLDAKLMYGRPVSATMRLEAFIDLFNVFNQQATVQTDDIYTFDPAAAIVNGTTSDLKYAKNLFGQPVTKNPDYGHALAYQLPFHGRLGLRLTF